MLIGRKHIVGLLLAGVMGAFVFAWSGLIGVGASTGHWKATDWFLHWVMRSSVRTPWRRARGGRLSRPP